MHEFKKFILAFALVLFLVLKNFSVCAQVCPIVTSSTSMPDCSTGCNVCPGDNITFSVMGNDLPDGGTIDWYTGSSPGFDPIGQGTFAGSSTITTTSGAPCTDCPEIMAIMMDACASPEGDNEFMIISSGSGFLVSDLSLDFAPQNNSGGPASDDINIGATCNWQAGNPNLITGCTNVIPAGPGTFIPAGSTVVIQTSSGGNYVYDFSATCGIIDCIYVISNTCGRGSFGGFTNCDGSGIRNYSIFLNSCACTSTATYSTDDPAIDCPAGTGPSDNGTYYINGGGFGNDGCPVVPGVAAGGGTSYPSTISDFTYTPTTADCTGSPIYLVGIPNPAPSNCCSPISTDYFELYVSCPTANAGVMITGCDIGNGTANFDLTSADVMVSGGTGTVNWYTDMGGTMLILDPMNFNSGSTTVYATVLDGCESSTEAVTLTVETGPVATAGGPIEICGAQNVVLNGSISPSAGGGIWTTSGDGMFVDMNNPMTSYNPGSADENNGTVQLTLTANAGPNCPGTASSLTLTIHPPATANAGGPYNICSGQTAQLSGTIGGSGVSGSWTTLGDGSFDNTNSTMPIYTPGLADIAIGIVNIQFSVNSSVGICPPVMSNAVINIAPGPSATIQGDTEVCSNASANLNVVTAGPAGGVLWSSSGDGIFSSTTNSLTNYTPGLSDIALGFATITVTVSSTNGCPATTDMITLNFNEGAMINTMVTNPICETEDVFLQLNSSQTLTTVMWSTSSGDGTFGNAFNSSTTYSPGPLDIQNGNVQIQVIGTLAPCTNYQESFSIDITPSPAFDLNANPTSLCGPGTIDLTAVADNINTGGILWSTSGDGTFNQINILTPMYTVGTNDIAAGMVTLYAQSSSVDVNCPSGLDSLVITIGSGPTIVVNSNPIGCDGEDILLDVTIGNGATTVTWSSSGDGSFDDVNSLTPLYTPGSSDQGSGSVILTVITDSPNVNCPAATEMINIAIENNPTISLGGTSMACGQEMIAVNSSTSANAGTTTWTTSGDGTFSSTTGSNTDYSIGASDVTNGQVTIYGTTDDPMGPCNAAIDSLVITIASPVTAGTPNAITVICDDATNIVDLFNELNAADAGGVWTEVSATSSTGTAFNAGAGSFNVSGQAANIYEFQYTINAVAPCLSDSAVVTVEIIASPSASVTASGIICNETAQGSIFNFDLLVTSGDLGGTWFDTGGTGVNLTNSAAVDFNTIAAGNYTFTYTTNSATAPCNEVSYTTVITVENCACPSPATNPLPALCDDAAGLDLSTYVATTESGSWAITRVPTGANPATISGDQFSGNGSDVGTYTLTFTLDAAPFASCPDSSVQTIELNPAVSSGTALATLEICNDQGQIINLFDRLTGEDTGGGWTETSAILSTGTAFDPAGSFNSNGQNSGVYTFEYAITGTAPCVNSATTVSINLVDPPSAIVEPIGQICNQTSQGSVFNFDLLIIGGDSGTWADTDGTSVNLTNTAAVDFNGVAAGVYTFTYTTNTAVTPCNEVNYTTAITVEDCACPSPATNPLPALCDDAAGLNLSTFVATTESGSWAITGVPAGTNPATISGDQFSGNGSDVGTYTLTFTLDAAPLAGCPDSSVQTIELNPAVSAGTALSTLEICNDPGQIINLFDRLTGEDTGGSWTETSAILSTGTAFDPAGSFNSSGQNSGTYTFEYAITGTAPCVNSAATVSINLGNPPSTIVFPNGQICNQTSQGSEFNFDLLIIGGDSGTWADTDGTGVNLTNSAAVDFNGVTAGIYTFTYTTNTAVAPCNEVSYTTSIAVADCACPSPATNALPDLCDNAAQLDLSTYINTIEAGSWSISSVPAGANPATLTGNSFNGTGSDVGQYTLTFTLDSAPLFNCPDSSVQTLTINPAPTATVNQSDEICNTSADGSILNFDLQVTAGDQSGTWLDTDGTGVDLSNLTTVDFDGVSAGIYTFTYTTNSAILPCQEQNYELEVTVRNCACPSVTTGPLPDLCLDNGVLNLSGFVLTSEPGAWSITGTPAGSNPATVSGDFYNGTNADPGTYDLTYTLSAAPILNCPDSSVQTLNLFAPTNSGTASFVLTGCNTETTPVNLNQFIFGADAGGTWLETSLNMSTGGAFDAVNGTFDLLNQSGGTYNFTYSVNANGACPGSATEYTVVVEEAETATLEAMNTICNLSADGSILNFNSIITMGSTMGNWVDSDGTGVSLSNLNSVDFNGVAAGSYTFTYLLPAGQFCASQSFTTIVNVQNCACPNPSTNTISDVCENAADLDLNNFNFSGQTGVWTIDNVNGLTNPNITANVMDIASGEPGDYQLTFTLDGGPFVGCPDSSVLNFSILPTSQTNYMADICSGDSIVINGTTYDDSRTSGMETIIGGADNGCDSTIFINLTVVNSIQLPEVDTTLCFGDAIELYGIVFDASNTGGMVTFDHSGCDSFLQVNVDFYPAVIENYNATLCTGESINVNGTIFDETLSSGQVVIPDGSTMGCDSTVNVNLSFDTEIASSITAVESVCLGDSVTLNFNFSSTSTFNITYSIDGMNFPLTGILDGHQETIFLTNDANILITNVTALGSTCAVVSPIAPLQIAVIDIEPMVSVLTDFNGFNVSCNAESDAEVFIDIIGGTPNYQFSWAGPEPDIDNLAAGFYSATVIDALGCRDSLEFNITEPNPTVLDLEGGSVNCPENQDGTITINDIQGPGSAYFFSLDNNNFTPVGSIPYVIQGLGAGTVNLFIEDENQCGASESVTIGLDNNLFTDISPDESLQLGDSTDILVDPNFLPVSIRWFPINGLSCTDCLNPTATPTTTTTYRVELEDEFGCIIEASVELRVERSNVYIPNVFSPNNDGNNDIFYIQTSNNNLIVEQMIIVDRWGEIVFQENDFALNDANFGWDGRLRDKDLNPGVFIYYLQIRYPDGELIPMKGDITLLR